MKKTLPQQQIREKLRKRILKQRDLIQQQQRVQFLINQQILSNPNSFQNQYQKLFMTPSQPLDYRKIALKLLQKQITISKAPLHVSNHTFLTLFSLLSSPPLTDLILHFLSQYTYHHSLPQDQLDLLYNNLETLLNILNPNNIDSFLSIISILGNATIDDSRIKNYITSSKYFLIVKQTLYENLENIEFVGTVLWQIKNLFKKTKVDNMVFEPKGEFLEYLVGLVEGVFWRLVEREQGGEEGRETERQCLVVVRYVLYNAKGVGEVMEKFVKRLIEYLMVGCEVGINEKLAKQIMNVIQQSCATDRNKFHQPCTILLLELIPLSLTTQTLYLNNQTLDLATTLNSPLIHSHLFQSLPHLKKPFQIHPHKLRWSQYILSTILPISNIQLPPKNQFQKMCQEVFMDLLKKVNLFLLDNDGEVVYNGVKIVYHLVSGVEEEKSMRGMLMETGMVEHLEDLMLHEDKNVYEMAEEVLEMLGLRQQEM